MVSERSITVYVIDDEAPVREALTRLLRSAGMQAHSFASVEEFMTAETPLPGACIVSDIRMPGISGVRLPGLLAEQGVKLPVIFVTAHDSPEVRDEARSAGAAGYFRKPIDDQALLDAIFWATSGQVAT